MVMTLRTGDGRSEPDSGSCIDAIDDRLPARFFIIDTTFLIEHGVAMKPGGDQLSIRRLRQHIAGELFDRELIERHVFVKGIDYPITIFPDHSRAIFFVAVGIGITRQVEPRSRPPLAKMWAHE